MRCPDFPHIDWFSADPLMQQAAVDVCHTCPTRLACLAGARERDEPHGVWGGEVFGEPVMVVAEPQPRERIEQPHATRARYNTCTAGEDGGKCDPCRAANAAYARARKAAGHVTWARTVTPKPPALFEGAS